MENETETQDSIPEGVQDTIPENGSDEVVEKLTKAEEYGKNQKIRAEKAESELKKFKAERPKETETPKNEIQSNEPDYAKLAFLEQRGLNHPDDRKLVQDEATRLKLPLTDVLGMDHIKSKLKSSKEQREAENGMPSGSGKPSGATKNSVDHWVNKKNSDGTFSTPDDLELATKVIDARIKQHVAQNKFADDLY